LGKLPQKKDLIMRKKVFAIPAVLVLLLSCGTTKTGSAGLKVREYDYGYEKTVFDHYRFEFEFHLGVLEGDKKIEGIIKNLIYDGNGPEAYVTYKEKAVLEDLGKDNIPPLFEEEGGHINRGEYIEIVEIKNHGDSFVILCREEYLYYSGQAHGIPRIQYYVVDLNEAKIVPLNGLALAIPDEILQAHIASQFNIDLYDRESIWPPDSISLEKDGALLCWNVYSIAPYSEGPIEITIPYGIANAYLTEKARSIRDALTAK
jgi:hypothetical protein